MVELQIIWGVKLFLMCWVLSSWASMLVDKINPYDKIESKFQRLLLVGGQYVLSCPKCFSFWLTLAITQNFFLAAGVSLCVMIVSKFEQSIKTKL
jgi:hypothetical protein